MDKGKGKFHTTPKPDETFIHTVLVGGSTPTKHEVYINGILLGELTKGSYMRTWEAACYLTAEVRQVQGFDRAIEELLHMRFGKEIRVVCAERLYKPERI